MDSINSIKSVQAQTIPASAEKPQDAPATGAQDAPVTEPCDEFAPLRPEPSIHSLKDYGNNIADSSKLGFAAGFIRTSEAVEKFMPSYDGLDHMGKHILCAIPPILAGVVGGMAGAGAGLVMGIFGKNIGTHMTGQTFQN